MTAPKGNSLFNLFHLHFKASLHWLLQSQICVWCFETLNTQSFCYSVLLPTTMTDHDNHI